MIFLLTVISLELLIAVVCAICLIMGIEALREKLTEATAAVNALIARIPTPAPPIDFTPEVTQLQGIIDAANATLPTP